MNRIGPSKKHDVLVREQADIQSRSTSGYVMQDKPEPAVAYILNRGEYDQRKEKVTPATPAFLPPFPDDLPHNRLGFAKWLLSPRIRSPCALPSIAFGQIFGTGLVKTAGDFGVTGDLPSIKHCSIGSPSISANRVGTSSGCSK